MPPPSAGRIAGRHFCLPAPPRTVRAGYLAHSSSLDQRPSRQGNAKAPGPDRIPFWFGPVSIFGLLNITAFSSTSPGLTYLQTASPRPPCDAGSRRVRSRSHDRPCDRGYIVTRASHLGITPRACRAGRPLAEQWVTSSLSFHQALQIFQTPRIAPADGSAFYSRMSPLSSPSCLIRLRDGRAGAAPRTPAVTPAGRPVPPAQRQPAPARRTRRPAARPIG